MITHTQLKELLNYDPEMGVFKWRRVGTGRRPMQAAGFASSAGWVISIYGRRYSAAKLAWLYMKGEWPERKMRFLDKNPGNICWANLALGRTREEFVAENRAENPKVVRERNQRNNLKRYEDMSVARYQRMFLEQKGLCAACKQPEKSKRNGEVRWLCVDHNHETGAVRGLLCNNCNLTIGLFREDIEAMERAAKYLEDFKARQKLKQSQLPPSNVVRLRG